MKINKKNIILYFGILLSGIFAPFIFPAYTFQFAVLWLMILFAVTWDILGGQMGYNSLGYIFFFGSGMYICAVVQIGMYYDVAEYTAHFGAVKIDFTPYQYFSGLALGLLMAALGSLILAVIFGWIVFGLGTMWVGEEVFHYLHIPEREMKQHCFFIFFVLLLASAHSFS